MKIKLCCFLIHQSVGYRITIRKCSEHPRRFICMRLETKLKLHNYQTKNGKDVMIYEDLKNNYE